MLLSFSANTLSPELLEKTLIGRKETLDELEQELLEKVLRGHTYQSLLIAPRGSGKTHLTTALRYRLKANPAVQDRALIAYMNEDERGIANFSDFIRHILQSFIKHKEGNYQILNDRIYEISGIAIEKQEQAFVTTLLDFIGSKSLIILIENLNVLFDKKTGMGLDGQTKLRSLMHEHNQFSILATSQNLFYQIQDAKAPFYSFFNIKHLRKLNFEESLKFIRIQAGLEDDASLSGEIDTPLFKGKVRAIYQLTGGNHRLLVIFFHFLKAEIKSDLSKVFEKTMNDLKPYYEQFVNALSPQQQKIIQFLSSKHTPQMGKDISRFCFIAPTTLSKQTSELVEKGYLDKEKVGKDTYYELKEALMRICFEINENADGVVKLFVDFLSVLYSEEELQRNYLEVKYHALTQVEERKAVYQKEALLHRTALSPEMAKALDEIPIEKCENSAELKETIDSAISNLQLCHTEKVTKECDGKSLIKPSDKDEKEWLHFSPLASKKLFIFQINYGVGLFLSGASKWTEAIECFEEAINAHPQSPEAYYYRGKVYFQLKKIPEALASIKRAIVLNPQYAKAYVSQGYSYILLGKHEEALSSLQESIKLDAKNHKAYFYQGMAFCEMEKFETGVTFFQKAIQLNAQYAESYLGLGVAYYRMKAYKKAIKPLEQAMELNPNQVIFRKWLAASYFEVSEYEKATEVLQEELHYEENDWATNRLMLRVWLGSDNLEKSKIQLGRVYNLANGEANSLVDFYEQDNLYPLFKASKLSTLSAYFPFLLETLDNEQRCSAFWKAFPKAIFTVLIDIEVYEEKRLFALHGFLQEELLDYKEATIPLLYLDIGIRYLKQGDQRAIFDLSKEERQVFKDFVLDKRERGEL